MIKILESLMISNVEACSRPKILLSNAADIETNVDDWEAITRCGRVDDGAVRVIYANPLPQWVYDWYRSLREQEEAKG